MTTEQIKTALIDASNNAEAWDSESLNDIASEIASGMPRREWVNLLAQQGDDSEEADRLIAAIDAIDVN